jgi:CheY-like chemotaxis protein
MLADSAVLKVLSHDVALKDAYDKVLAEESESASGHQHSKQECGAPGFISVPAACVHSGRLLVVDDDRDMAGFLSRILSDAGYLVSVANDGIDAVMQILKGNFALVISDLEMPNLDGLQLAGIVAQKNLGTGIIMLSASTDEASEERALALGALDYIRKPVKKDVLLLRVKKALSQLPGRTEQVEDLHRAGLASPGKNG